MYTHTYGNILLCPSGLLFSKTIGAYHPYFNQIIIVLKFRKIEFLELKLSSRNDLSINYKANNDDSIMS